MDLDNPLPFEHTEAQESDNDKEEEQEDDDIYYDDDDPIEKIFGVFFGKKEKSPQVRQDYDIFYMPTTKYRTQYL